MQCPHWIIGDINYNLLKYDMILFIVHTYVVHFLFVLVSLSLLHFLK